MNELPIELLWHIGTFLNMKDHIKAIHACKDFVDNDRLRKKRYEWCKNRLLHQPMRTEIAPARCVVSSCQNKRATCFHLENGLSEVWPEILSYYCSKHCRLVYYNTSPILLI